MCKVYVIFTEYMFARDATVWNVKICVVLFLILENNAHTLKKRQ